MKHLTWIACIGLLCVGGLNPVPGNETPGRSSPILSIEGDRFLLEGEPFDMWGIRVASATKDDAACRQLIDQLDDYLAHGVNTVTVFYSGSSAGYYDPFSADGKAIDPGHQARMERIIEACAQRGMVVVVGIFYQRINYRLTGEAALTETVRTVTRALRPYGNIIINIANEQNSPRYRGRLTEVLRDPQTIIDLCGAVKEVDSGRLVGGGGYDHANNEVIGRSQHVDVLLFDTAGIGRTSGELYKQFRQAGVTNKPIVNVETFGGWTRNFPPGVFPPEVRAAYQREIDSAAAEPGLSVFLHNNPWLQGPSGGHPLRYDLGGAGTEEDPGIRWYFESVRQARKGAGTWPSPARTGGAQP